MQEDSNRVFDNGSAAPSGGFNNAEQNDGMFDAGNYQPDPR